MWHYTRVIAHRKLPKSLGGGVCFVWRGVNFLAFLGWYSRDTLALARYIYRGCTYTLSRWALPLSRGGRSAPLRLHLREYNSLHDLKRLNTWESVYKDTLLEGNPIIKLFQLNRGRGLTPTDPRQTKIFHRENENFSHWFSVTYNNLNKKNKNFFELFFFYTKIVINLYNINQKSTRNRH